MRVYLSHAAAKAALSAVQVERVYISNKWLLGIHTLRALHIKSVFEVTSCAAEGVFVQEAQ
jgi:hypothetical protein